jgi:small subunit ribosomal protein S11
MGKKKVVSKKENIAEGEEKQAKAASKKSSKSIDVGRIYISVSFNNTIITVTDSHGNVVTWASAGSLGFSGPKKATPFAAQKIVAAIAEKIARSGPFNVDVIISGVSVGRDSAIRSLANHGFNILSIKDVTPVPHNGPRQKKPRRV